MSTIVLFRVTEVKGQTCWWEHHSYVDCAYDLNLGFICKNVSGPLFTHDHSFGTILCTGGNPIPGSGWQAGCGGWLNPGGTYDIAGCGYCGDPDSSLCDNAGYTGQEAFKYLTFKTVASQVYQPVTAYDWRQYDRFEFTFGYYPNIVACCFDMNPLDCTANACGVPEVDWEDQITKLMPAYDPRYPSCPDPY